MSDEDADKKQIAKIPLRRKRVPTGSTELAGEAAEDLRSAVIRMPADGNSQFDDTLKFLRGPVDMDLRRVVIPLHVLELLPLAVARQRLAIPFKATEHKASFLMADPNNRLAIEELERLSGRLVTSYKARHGDLQRVIEEAYRRRELGEQYYLGSELSPDEMPPLVLETDQPAQGRSSPYPPSVAANGPSLNTMVTQIPPRRDTSELLRSALETEPDAYPSEPALRRALPGERRSQEVRHFSLSTGAARQPRRERARIVVADEQQDFRRLMSRVLGGRGYEVVEAASSDETLEQLSSNDPDLVLMDASLPGLHGFELCLRIKNEPRFHHIPIIMCSAVYRGWRLAEDLRESYGVYTFLEKPFKVSEVVQAVERALSGKAVVDEEESLSPEVEAVLAKSVEAYQRGDIDTAIAHLQEGIAIDPLCFKLHYHLGLLFGRRDELLAAIETLETAVDLHPRNFSALKNLAVLYQRAGFKRKAVEMWERALSCAVDGETREGIKEHLISLL